MTTLNYNLKDKNEEYSLILLSTVFNKERVRVSTQQKVYTKSWDKEIQRCVISSNLPDRLNRQLRKVNKFLDSLEKVLTKDVNDVNFQFRYTKIEDWVKLINTRINTLIGIEEEEVKQAERKMTDVIELTIKNKKISKNGKEISYSMKVDFNSVLINLKEYLIYTKQEDTFEIFNKLFIDKFKEYCITKKYNHNTIYLKFNIIRILLKEAVKKEGVDLNDFKFEFNIKQKPTDTVYLTRTELDKIYSLKLAKKVEIVRDMFILSANLGTRFSDLNSLNKTAVFNLVNNTVTYISIKTSNNVTIPLSAQVVALYKKYEGKFEHVSLPYFNKTIQKICEMAKIEDEIITNEVVGGKEIVKKLPKYKLVKSHTARRSFATNLYLQGAPVLAIMKLTGHKSQSSFLKYIKVTDGENVDMMQKFFK